MDLLELLVMILIAGFCGYLATVLMGAKRVNFVLMILIGFIGAALGRWLAHLLHLPMFLGVTISGHYFPLLWALIGSVVLVGIGSALRQH
jgi:uncharacterized membrane protein YeaQ/YmgE (transglycosylase-associated protein family)